MARKSVKLESRQKNYDDGKLATLAGKLKYHRPGSQNHKK